MKTFKIISLVKEWEFRIRIQTSEEYGTGYRYPVPDPKNSFGSTTLLFLFTYKTSHHETTHHKMAHHTMSHHEMTQSRKDPDHETTQVPSPNDPGHETTQVTKRPRS
jgi:hypothetical protein